MPAPSVLAIPALATFLGGLFTKLFEGLALVLTRRLAIILAAITAIVALTSAFFITLTTLVNSLIPSFPSWVNMGLGHVLPTTWPLIVSSVLSAHVIRWVYVWNVKVVQFRMF